MAALESNLSQVRFEQAGDTKQVVLAATGQPFSGELIARDDELRQVADGLSLGEALIGDFVSVRGLIGVLPVNEGIVEGKATLHVDLTAKDLTGLIAGRTQFKAVPGQETIKVGEATFEGGKLNGPASLWAADPSGSGKLLKFAEVEFRANRLFGVAREYYAGSTQTKREVSFENGRPNGTTRAFYEDGTLKHETSLVAGGREEKGYFANGKLRVERRYKDGQLVDEQARFPSGSKHKVFKDGDLAEWYSNGEIKLAAGELDPRDVTGVVEEFYPDGTRWEQVTLSDGVVDGEHIKWWKNGKLALKETYSKGTREGSYERWYTSGQLWEKASYVAGAKHGPYKKWWKNGKLAQDYRYKAGRIDGPYLTFYDSGAKWAVGVYANGKPTGVMKRWFPDGKLGFEQHHQDGRPHGPFNRWYANGQKRLEANYVKGRLDGEFKNWLEDGTVYEIATYKNGAKLKSTR